MSRHGPKEIERIKRVMAKMPPYPTDTKIDKHENIKVMARALRNLADDLAQCRAQHSKLMAVAKLMADQAQVCLDNAHWDVSYGSGELRESIKAVNSLQASNEKGQR